MCIVHACTVYTCSYVYAVKKSKLHCRYESLLILKGGMVRASNLAFVMMSASLMAFVVFCVYTATGGDLTPKKVFTTLSLIYVLRLISVHHLILNVVGFSEAHVAVTRINVRRCMYSTRTCIIIAEQSFFYCAEIPHISREYESYR